MSEVAVILGLLFALSCGVLAVMHSLKMGRMTLLDWSLLGLGGMYGLGWGLVVTITQSGGNPTWERWINPFESMYPLHTMSAFLLTIGIIGGWYVTAPYFRLSSTRILSVSGCKPNTDIWASAFWLMLVLAVLMQWLYARAYGGLVSMLDFSVAIRSALFGEVLENKWSFLRPFGGLAMIAAYGFFGLLLSGRYKIGTIFGFALSFLFSLYILYTWLGRVVFAVFLATFFLGVVLMRRQNPIKMMSSGLIVFMLILFLAHGVSVWMSFKAADSLTVFLTREFSFPFGSFFAQLNFNEHLFRGFLDFAVVPLYFLPSSWHVNWIEPVSQVNTAIIMGAPKGEAGVTGGIPVDLLTLGLMQAHIFGVPITGLLFGILLRALQFLLDRIPLIGVRGIFEAYVALKISILGIFYSQPNLFISSNFPLILGAMIISSLLVSRRFKLFPITKVKQPL
jgi:hypothetical protein